MLEVTIIAKIQTVSIENIFYDGDIVRWRMSMRTQKRKIAHLYRILEVTIIAKIQTVSIENIFYDGDIVRWRMSMRTPKAQLCAQLN
jgi:uncharacterized protein YcnI